MNINEAKQKLHDLAFAKMNCKPDDLKLADVMQILNQIDTQPKVIVPKFVAEWYEKHKTSLDYNLYLYLISLYEEKLEKNDFYYWMQKSNNPIQAIINMHQFGYEVEQEQLYTVEIPNPNRSGRGHAKFMLEKQGDKVFLVKRKSSECYQNKDGQKLTESEIKKDFEWAWDAEFAKPVQKEVE